MINSTTNEASKKIIFFILFFILTISWSQAFGYLSGVKTTLWSSFALIFLYGLTVLTKEKFSIVPLFFGVLFIFPIVCIGMFKGTFVYIQGFLQILMSALVVSSLRFKKNDYVYLFKNLSYFAFFSLFCSILSFIYAYNGGDSLFSFSLLDGRVSYFHLSSFSNVWIGNMIRPGFIYDEPGAYSFFLCFVCLGRVLLGMDNKATFLILLFGLITLSMMHVIVFISFILLSINLRQRIVIAILIFSLLLGYFSSELTFLDLLFERLTFSSDALYDNNRAEQIFNFIHLFNDKPEVIYTGYDDFFNKERELYHRYGDMGASPITPILQYGLPGLFVLLSIISILLGSLFRRTFDKNVFFVSMIMCLLILQRPFYHGSGYSLMVIMITFLTVNYKKLKT